MVAGSPILQWISGGLWTRTSCREYISIHTIWECLPTHTSSREVVVTLTSLEGLVLSPAGSAWPHLSALNPLPACTFHPLPAWSVWPPSAGCATSPLTAGRAYFPLSGGRASVQSPARSVSVSHHQGVALSCHQQGVVQHSSQQQGVLGSQHPLATVVKQGWL